MGRVGEEVGEERRRMEGGVDERKGKKMGGRGLLCAGPYKPYNDFDKPRPCAPIEPSHM